MRFPLMTYAVLGVGILVGTSIAQPEPGADIVALDEALDALAAFEPRGAQVVELRFFGGLTVEETAEVLKVSPRTVKRDWTLARAWILEALRPGGTG